MLCSDLLSLIKGKRLPFVIFAPSFTGAIATPVNKFSSDISTFMHQASNAVKAPRVVANSVTLQLFLADHPDARLVARDGRKDVVAVKAGSLTLHLPLDTSVILPTKFSVRPKLSEVVIRISELREATKTASLFLCKDRNALSVPYLIRSRYFCPAGMRTPEWFAYGTDGIAMMTHAVDMQSKWVQFPLPPFLSLLLQQVKDDRLSATALKSKQRAVMQVGDWTCNYPATKSPRLSYNRLDAPIDLIFSSEQLTSAAAKAVQFRLGDTAHTSSTHGGAVIDFHFEGKRAHAAYLVGNIHQPKHKVLPLPFKISVQQAAGMSAVIRMRWPLLQKLTRLRDWTWEVRLQESAHITRCYATKKLICEDPIVLRDKTGKITCLAMPTCVD